MAKSQMPAIESTPRSVMPVGLAALGRRRGVAQHLAVALLAHDVRVEVGDAHERAARRGARIRRAGARDGALRRGRRPLGTIPREHLHDDVEVKARVRALNRDGGALQVGDDLLHVGRRNVGDHFQPAGGLAPPRCRPPPRPRCS